MALKTDEQTTEKLLELTESLNALTTRMNTTARLYQNKYDIESAKVALEKLVLERKEAAAKLQAELLARQQRGWKEKQLNS